jgi:hypothetical protein
MFAILRIEVTPYHAELCGMYRERATADGYCSVLKNLHPADCWRVLPMPPAVDEPPAELAYYVGNGDFDAVNRTVDAEREEAAARDLA